jgi:hypothetical protein
MLELLCWLGVGLAVLSASAIISFVCGEVANDRRRHMDKSGRLK